MGAISGKDYVVAVCATAGGTYVPVGYAHTASGRRGATTGENIYTFSNPTPITEAGDTSRTLDINFLLDLTDAGQELIRDALDSGDTVFVRKLYDGDNGEQWEASVSNYQDDADANGTGINRFVRGSCTLTGIGDVTPITGG